MEISQYLQRIGLKDIKGISIETLSQLQMQHMLHIPFENLDVMHNVPIPLDVETYYNKIVLNQRGGFCYELNGLFNWLLQGLGFNNHLIAGTVRTPKGTWAKEESHAAQIVQLDLPYLVDVGFGDSTRMPLPLTGEPQEDVSGVYRAEKIEESIFDLQRKGNDAEWNTLLRFDITPKKLMDFEEACHFNQTSPDSHFTNKELITIATSDGRITLSGDTLVVTHNGEKQEKTVHNSERAAVLERYFGIHLKES
ncbi:arylamine N-acetyltransferase family protein [Sporosarcina newyorkensis]|uniref:N-hydroxyarylamine O-acetyltransferase n=1 Tax=Sporosarcina newyorkensis TaxID=759851 RepID=A0A1T4Y920_9BACL|nr:arylamine N-acetyltransferase [Sporosarcina newyorkensis]SKA97781.1 N-hydroxyarylamine O-acetyltransferase [Sporosarcina newyorkensis]